MYMPISWRPATWPRIWCLFPTRRAVAKPSSVGRHDSLFGRRNSIVRRMTPPSWDTFRTRWRPGWCTALTGQAV